MNRRQVLASTGVALTGGLAGCSALDRFSGNGNGDGDSDGEAFAAFPSVAAFTYESEYVVDVEAESSLVVDVSTTVDGAFNTDTEIVEVVYSSTMQSRDDEQQSSQEGAFYYDGRLYAKRTDMSWRRGDRIPATPKSLDSFREALPTPVQVYEDAADNDSVTIEDVGDANYYDYHFSGALDGESATFDIAYEMSDEEQVVGAGLDYTDTLTTTISDEEWALSEFTADYTFESVGSVGVLDDRPSQSS